MAPFATAAALPSCDEILGNPLKVSKPITRRVGYAAPYRAKSSQQREVLSPAHAKFKYLSMCMNLLGVNLIHKRVLDNADLGIQRQVGQYLILWDFGFVK